MSLLGIQSTPAFVAGNDLHATDGVQVLWDNARQLDLASLAPRDLFQGHGDFRIRLELFGENPLDWARGGYRYRTGLTTLTVTVAHVLGGGGVAPRLRVLVNGVSRIDAALTGVGTQQTVTATGMASWGLTDGQPVDVRMEIYDSGQPGPSLPDGVTWGRYYLVDAYVSPASAIIADAYPGEPTFTTGPEAAKLTQLGNAELWLARRMAAVPQPLFQRIVSSPELPWWTLEPGEPGRHLWSGGGPRGPFDRIRARVVWVKGTAPSQRIRMLIDGVEVATTPNIAAGGWNHTFDVNIAGYSATAPLRVELELVVDAGSDGGYSSRLSVEYVELARATPAIQTLSDRPVAWESTTWATRKARLNQIAAVLSTVKSRIDADADRWDRIRLFRSSYAYGPINAEYLKGRYHAVRRQRTGARLVVRGSNLKLGWGALGATLVDPKEPQGEYAFTWAVEETLVGGSEVETREVALDGLGGLLPGMTYQVYGGDVRYAAEEAL